MGGWSMDSQRQRLQKSQKLADRVLAKDRPRSLFGAIRPMANCEHGGNPFQAGRYTAPFRAGICVYLVIPNHRPHSPHLLASLADTPTRVLLRLGGADVPTCHEETFEVRKLNVAVAAAAAALAFCFRCKVALRPCCRGSVKWLLLFCFCLLLLLLLGADLQLALFDIRLLYPLGTRLEMTSSEFSSVQFV